MYKTFFPGRETSYHLYHKTEEKCRDRVVRATAKGHQGGTYTWSGWAASVSPV